MFRIQVGLIVMGFAVQGPVNAQQPAGQKVPADVAKAQEAVTAYLARINDKNSTTIWLSDESLAKTFPNHAFFAVRYRIYPVAMQMPAGMAPSNIFAVKDGKAEHVKDDKALEAFFKSNAAAARNADGAKGALRSWLVLAQEFVQDGYYTFEILDKETTVNATTTAGNGREVVMKGGNGDITVAMTWDVGGKFTGATSSTKVKPGPRPICQATKLLDADPIVRKMAEQDLLYLGLAAREYIVEQRAVANPELREAIDRIWDRILKNGS